MNWDFTGFYGAGVYSCQSDPIAYYQTVEGDLLLWYGSIRVLTYGRASKLVAWRPTRPRSSLPLTDQLLPGPLPEPYPQLQHLPSRVSPIRKPGHDHRLGHGLLVRVDLMSGGFGFRPVSPDPTMEVILNEMANKYGIQPALMWTWRIVMYGPHTVITTWVPRTMCHPQEEGHWCRAWHGRSNESKRLIGYTRG